VQLLNKIQLPAAAGRHGITRARWAATAFFAVDGFIFASWAVRIPAVKVAAHASPAALGLALLGLSGGAIATMTVSGALCRRFGSSRVLVAAGALMSLALLLPPLARSVPWLGLGLVVFGIGYGCVNVAMNSIAVDVVAAVRRPVMPSFHAAWSLGGLFGAGLGGLLAPHLAPLPHLGIVSAAGLAVTVICGRMLLACPVTAAAAGAGEPGMRPGSMAGSPAGSRPDSPAGPRLGSRPDSPAGPRLGSRPGSPAGSRPGSRPGSPAGSPPGSGGHAWRVVLLFGLIALCSAYGEGAIGDWGALHLRQDLGAGAGLAAAGYAAFALAEACGRLAGSWLLSRLGQARVLILGGLTACAGMLAAALAPVLPIALAGFALTGLGVANMFPAAMTRAGLLAGPHGVAVASTLGYTGFLLGPPAIGFLASSAGLGAGLTSVSALALAAAAIAWLARS
jgi:MFS family permease